MIVCKMTAILFQLNVLRSCSDGYIIWQSSLKVRLDILSTLHCITIWISSIVYYSYITMQFILGLYPDVVTK